MSHLTDFQTFLLLSILKIAVVLVITLTAVAYTVLLERKVLGRMQNRWGPSRVGPFGLLQPLADGIKLFLKEDLMPLAVERPLFLLAPDHRARLRAHLHRRRPLRRASPRVHGVDIFEIANVNIGLLVILGITSIGVYGIALSGWSSNNKYSLLRLPPRHRAGDQLRARPRPLAGRRRPARRLAQPARPSSTRQSAHGLLSWNIFGGFQFVAFFIYLMAAYAETNRAPFDLPEAETELVAGYHTEYSSMKFAMFFMAEYANMITVACVATLLFFGGASSRPSATSSTASAGPILARRLLHLLVRLQDLRVPLALHLGARHAAALPLRPAHELRLEVPPARRHGSTSSSPASSLALHARLTATRCFTIEIPATSQLGSDSRYALTTKDSDGTSCNSHSSSSSALLAVAGALNLLFQRHPINSALSLVVVMMSLAVLYWSLGAEFLAAAQVIVYSGAIMVLFVFVIMLLNAGEEERTTGSRAAYIAGIPGAAAIFCLLSFVFLSERNALGTANIGGYLDHGINNIAEISSHPLHQAAAAL